MCTGGLFSMLSPFFCWTGALEIYLGGRDKSSSLFRLLFFSWDIKKLPNPSPSIFRLTAMDKNLKITQLNWVLKG